MEEPTLKKLTITLGLALASSVLAGVVSAKPITKLSAPVTQENRFFSHKQAGIHQDYGQRDLRHS